MDGTKDVPVISTAENEEVKLWLLVRTELENRGHFPGDEAVFKLIYMAI